MAIAPAFLRAVSALPGKQGVVLRLGTQGRRKAVRRLRTTTPIYNSSGGPLKQAHLFVAALDISRVFFASTVTFDVLRRIHNGKQLHFFRLSPLSKGKNVDV